MERSAESDSKTIFHPSFSPYQLQAFKLAMENSAGEGEMVKLCTLYGYLYSFLLTAEKYVIVAFLPKEHRKILVPTKDTTVQSVTTFILGVANHACT